MYRHFCRVRRKWNNLACTTFRSPENKACTGLIAVTSQLFFLFKSVRSRKSKHTFSWVRRATSAVWLCTEWTGRGVWLPSRVAILSWSNISSCPVRINLFPDFRADDSSTYPLANYRSLVHSMKACGGSGGIAPLILNLGARRGSFAVE